MSDDGDIFSFKLLSVLGFENSEELLETPDLSGDKLFDSKVSESYLEIGEKDIQSIVGSSYGDRDISRLFVLDDIGCESGRFVCHLSENHVCILDIFQVFLFVCFFFFTLSRSENREKFQDLERYG